MHDRNVVYEAAVAGDRIRRVHVAAGAVGGTDVDDTGCVDDDRAQGGVDLAAGPEGNGHFAGEEWEFGQEVF